MVRAGRISTVKPEQYAEIRALYAEGKLSMARIGKLKQYNCSPTRIYQIVRFKTNEDLNPKKEETKEQ